MSHELCSHFIIADGFELPNTFANRAVWALWALKSFPDKAEVDHDGLVWCQNDDDGLWYSIAGNYSGYSPAEKIVLHGRREIDKQREIDTAQSFYERVLYQSNIRQMVLDRDEYTCQICGCVKETGLHVHHIMKRKEGGTDHLDNLLTVCPSCHAQADRKLYNPDWANPREGVK